MKQRKKPYRYTWDMICREDPETDLNDGSHTIVLSTCGENDDEVAEGLVKFLKFVGADPKESQKDYEDSYVRRLQESVEHVKTSREMEDCYMLWEEMIDEEREEAREEGRAEGLTEGLAKGSVASHHEMILEILSDLTDDLSPELRKCIEDQTDPDILKEYFRKARKATSIEEFEEWINKI